MYTLLRRSFPALALAATVLTAGGAAQAETDPSFYITNNGRVTIQEVYVSSARRDDWGRDRLGENVLSAGRRVMIRLPDGQCVNDIKVVFDNGRETERRNQNTCNITEMSFP